MVPARDGRGRDADAPERLPPGDGGTCSSAVKAESQEDHVVLLAGGVALLGLLALVPAMIALMSINGLVPDADSIEKLTDALLRRPPRCATRQSTAPRHR